MRALNSRHIGLRVCSGNESVTPGHRAIVTPELPHSFILIKEWREGRKGRKEGREGGMEGRKKGRKEGRKEGRSEKE